MLNNIIGVQGAFSEPAAAQSGPIASGLCYL
jgi:hypothetical protein